MKTLKRKSGWSAGRGKLIVVVDTNIIISGLINQDSSSGTILKLILSGKIKLGIDNSIIGEYKEVLLRKKFNFEKELVDYILDEIEGDGTKIIPEPLDLSLPDKDDLPFLEVAVAGNIKILITGNRKHFPKNNYRMVKIYSPSEFIKDYDRLKQ